MSELHSKYTLSIFIESLTGTLEERVKIVVIDFNFSKDRVTSAQLINDQRIGSFLV